MRITATLAAGAVTVLVGAAVVQTLQPAGDDGARGSATAEAGVDHLGELYADAETGCIVIPDEPGPPPQVWRDQPLPEDLELRTEPWPRCETAG